MPDTVEGARARLTGLADRLSFVASSFFDPLPGDADVYVLARVLHDWSDEDAARILSRCAQAADADGRVLVVDRCGTAEDDMLEFTEMDLKMMVLFGARERTEAGFAALADRAGLQRRSTKPLDGVLTMLEFTPRDARARP